MKITVVVAAFLFIGAGCGATVKQSNDIRFKNVEYQGKWITITLNEGHSYDEFYRLKSGDRLDPKNGSLVVQGTMAAMKTNFKDGDKVNFSEIQAHFGAPISQDKSKDGQKKYSDFKTSEGALRVTEFDAQELSDGSVRPAGAMIEFIPNNLTVYDLFEPAIANLIDRTKDETILYFNSPDGNVTGFIFHIKHDGIIDNITG